MNDSVTTWRARTDGASDVEFIADLRRTASSARLKPDELRQIEERLFQYILDRYEAAATELAELKGGAS